MGGIDRKLGVQTQRPFTTPQAENVRSDGTIEGRERGGSRPGLTPFGPDSLGTRIQAINSSKKLSEGSTPATATENFAGTEPPDLLWRSGILPWAQRPRVAILTPGLDIWPGNAIRITDSAEVPPDIGHIAYLQESPADSIDLNQLIVVGGYIGPTAYRGQAFYLMLHCNGFNEPGITASLFIDGRGSLGAALGLWKSGTLVVPGSGQTNITPREVMIPGVDRGWFHLVWSPGIVQVWFGATSFADFFGGLLLNQMTGALANPTTKAPQVGYGFTTDESGTEQPATAIGFHSIKHFYFDNSTVRGLEERLVVVSNGSVYSGNELSLSRVGIRGILNVDAEIQTASRSDRIYFANYRPNSPNDQLPMYFYVLGTDRVKLWGENANVPVPLGNPIVALYRDRILLAGAEANPHLWHLSAQGFPEDFQSATGLDGEAISGQNSEAGQLADPITAVMPLGDDYLLFAGDSSMHVLAGDPGFGGTLDNVSRKIGVVSRFAWTYGPNSELIFLSRDGLYVLPPGVGPVPISLSRERLPDNLMDLGSNPDVHLIYNVELRGVHIYIKRSRMRSSVWWFDWETRGFWFDTMAFGHTAGAVYDFMGKALIGGHDGKLRVYDRQAGDDDGVPFPTEVMIGPIQLGIEGERDGLLNEIVGIPAEGSGDVRWSVHVGNTAEEAFKAEAFDSGVWSPGINLRDRPRARGQSAFLKIKGIRNATWAMEGITMQTEVLGGLRIA